MNIDIYPRQSDVTQFYNDASLVLNLSDRTQFIETFGMTALEAMAAALPVIVPTEGGIAEMVEDGQNGYKIDVQQLDKIAAAIDKVLADKALYQQLAKEAQAQASQYDEAKMINQIIEALEI